jgi:anaerobic selenocysteine-containing dehydrogenase
MSDAPSRRDFLTYSGAAIAGVTLGQAGRRWLARLDERAAAWRGRAVETRASSVCRACPAGCGIRVRLIDDVPVKIDGNPLCPIARGRVCAKGLAALESYFDPDRFLGPAHRIAHGGRPRWEPLPWPDATALAAERLKAAVGRQDGIVVAAAAARGPEAEAWTQFWRAAGAHLAWTPRPTADRLRPRLRAMTGAEGDPIFDLEHASYVLSFGAPLAEDWMSGVWTQRSFGRFRRSPGTNRGHLVQIDGRRSATARKADEWLAVAPDRQATLAFGIASVLFRENRIDADRLAPIAGNVLSFEHQLTTYYTPDDVAGETGVPVVTILRLARELASTPQPLVVVHADAGPDLVDAVLSLNVLVGAIDRPGGLFVKGDQPLPDREDAPAILRQIAEGQIRPSVLVLADSSALRALDAAAELGALTARVPFVLSLSPYADEAAAIADLVLPTDVPIETWHALTPPAAIGAEAVAIAAPAVARKLDTRDSGSILRALADGVGGAVKDVCWWTSSEDLVRAELKRLSGLRRGTAYATTYETEWMRELETGGWWAPAVSSADAFSTAVLAAGGWVDPYFDQTQLSETLRVGRGVSFPLPEALPIAARAADEGSSGQADSAFPITLVAFQPMVSATSGDANQPVLFELLGQPESLPWSLWVEVGAELADRLRIEKHARVRVTSASDTLDVVAVRVNGMPSGVAALSVVASPQAGGRWSGLLGKDGRRLWGPHSAAGPCAVQITRT